MTQQPDDLVEQKPAWWMQRYIETQAATITALRQRVAELEGEIIRQAEIAHGICAGIAIHHSNYGHVEGNKRAFAIAADIERRASAIRNRSNDHEGA